MDGLPADPWQADARPIHWDRSGSGVLVERSADGAVVRIADPAPGLGGPLPALVGALAAAGYGCTLALGAYADGRGWRGETVSVAYVAACVAMLAAWRAWPKVTPFREVFRIGGGFAQVGGEAIPAANLGDIGVLSPDGAADAPADDGEMDCRSRTQPLRARRSYAVVIDHRQGRVVVARCVTRSQAAAISSAVAELLRQHRAS